MSNNNRPLTAPDRPTTDVPHEASLANDALLEGTALGNGVRREAFILDANAVHVWHFPLDIAPEPRAALAALLVPDEMKRAARFHFDRDRERYVVGRGTLRLLLGKYLNTAAQDITFCYGAQGKPCLAAPADASGLHFNLSHSADRALLAVSRGRQVGVDIEAVRPNVDCEVLAQTYFSPAEREALFGLPQAERAAAFFRLWTRKESYLKALGGGLMLPLDSFDVSLVPDAPNLLCATRPDASAALCWRMISLSAPLGFAAALTAEGHDWQEHLLPAASSGTPPLV